MTRRQESSSGRQEKVGLDSLSTCVIRIVFGWLFWHVKIGISSASLAQLRLADDESELGKRQDVFVDAGEAASQPEHLATAIFNTATTTTTTTRRSPPDQRYTFPSSAMSE
jgi:hypothetical protein